MISLKRKAEGFTIVELLIVIVVIGILAALVITTFTGIQQKARDTKRKTDIQTFQSQLEAYYTTNGNYPTISNINTAGWVATNMKGMDPTGLQDPQGTSQTVVAAPAPKVYAYNVTASDGVTACDNSATQCAKYVLTATLESGGGTYVKNSLN
ncbi:MAG: hypothetical protein NVS3B23_00930 [Candidatus Saccharimonadales bacterium]